MFLPSFKSEPDFLYRQNVSNIIYYTQINSHTSSNPIYKVEKKFQEL